MVSRIPTLSLFSGAGGLDIGFLQAGFDIQACVEIEPSYAKTLRANAAAAHSFSRDARIYCQDIRAFDPAPFENTGIQCIIGGPPCQTFSAAGRRSGGVIGVDDLRGQLFRTYCEILERIKPKVFVFENVYGLPGANGGAPWREIIETFAAVGYELRAEVVDTADYGVPQHRERLIMIGFKSGEFVFPTPTHGPDSETGESLVSVEMAIEDLQIESEPYHNGVGGLYGHLLPEVPEGLNYAYFTAEMGHPRPAFAWRSKFHDLLYKVKRDEPCRTIKAQPGKFTGPFHWKNRHFNASELKRLQTFPDDYEIVGSYGKVVEQIGNSVPPKLAYVIATSVREQLLEKTPDLTFPVRSLGFRSTFRQRQREKSKRFKLMAQHAHIGRAIEAPAERSGTDVVERYSLNPVTLFDRRKLDSKASRDHSLPIFDISVLEDQSHIEIHVSKQKSSKVVKTSTISITGLRKYLPLFDTCTILAQIESFGDVFHCWNAVEEALTARSQFFTLIDIYGHYANKGDAVEIISSWNLLEDSRATKLLNRFSSTLSCGAFLRKDQIANELGMGSIELSRSISALRSFRFDVRTSDTHPIIGPERMIFTYPFPLLSPRALVESRARMVRQEGDHLAGSSYAFG